MSLILNKEEIERLEHWMFVKYGNEYSWLKVDKIEEMVPIYLEKEGMRIFEVQYRKNSKLILTEDELYNIIKRV